MKPGVRPPAALLDAHAAPLLLGEDGVLAGLDVGSHVPREDNVAVLEVIIHEALRILGLARGKSHCT
jgi:hypothetical protein